MKRAALMLTLMLAAGSAQAQTGDEGGPVDDDGQEAAAAAARKAAEAATAKKPKKRPNQGKADEAAAAAPAAAAPAAAPSEPAEAPAEPEPAPPASTKPATPAPAAAAPTAPADAGGLTLDDLPSWDDAANDAPLDGTPGNQMQANWDAAAGPEAEVSFPWVEHHGYFRARGDLFFNFDLDTFRIDQAGEPQGTSPVRPPLTEVDRAGPQHPENPQGRTFNRDADSLAGANMRLRYAPTLHISESLRVRTTFDIFDNLVLGSTPSGGPISAEYSRPDSELEFFSEGQRPLESGANGWRDSIRVKHLWGEWKTPVGLLAVGRTQSHWGLGMVANAGDCLDCDFGDSVDRVMGVTKLFDTYLALTWDFPAEGPVGYAGTLDSLNQPLGQAYDFDQRDDVGQWTIAIFSKPYGREEQQTRQRDLVELRKPTIDWGVYTVIRTQSLSSVYDGTAPLDESTFGDDAGYKLREIDAFSFMPDVWFDFQYQPNPEQSYRLQFEGAALFGGIDEVPQKFGEPAQLCPNGSDQLDDCADDIVSPRKRDLLAFGYALEFDARYKSLNFGFHHGLATGDDQEGFGYLDSSPLNSQALDDKLTNFRFDRDYHVDLILFRELIGGVTNAAYFKPYIGYDLIDEENEAWGFQLSAMYAFALKPEATPGNESSLGFEVDIELYIHEFDRFKWSMQYGLLVPGGAFKLLDPDTGRSLADPSIAQTLQMMIGMEF